LNEYFGLSVLLPPGWSEGFAGPPPSRHGSYVLAALDGTKAGGASMMIVAQDLFFSPKALANAADMAADFRDAILDIPDMTIDRGPAEVTIGGRAFRRIDYHAGGLYRVWLATDLRCHVVIFNITGTDQARVDGIARGLDAMSLPAATGTQPSGGDGEQPNLMCIKEYVTAQTLRRRVDPVPIDSKGLKVPVRIIIGPDGRVRHVHVVSASQAQRRAIVDALMQWEFAPLGEMGHRTEVETGLIFEFKPHGP
jgi:hypothetical protein